MLNLLLSLSFPQTSLRPFPDVGAKDRELSKTVAISVQNLKLKMFKWKKKFKNIDVYFSKTPLSCQGLSLCVSFPIVANRQGMCVPQIEEWPSISSSSSSSSSSPPHSSPPFFCCLCLIYSPASGTLERLLKGTASLLLPRAWDTHCILRGAFRLPKQLKSQLYHFLGVSLWVLHCCRSQLLLMPSENWHPLHLPVSVNGNKQSV